MTIGITSERFANMTFVEVRDEIDAYNRRKKMAAMELQQLQAAGDYQLAQLIGIMFNDPKKYPKSIKKAYPELFDSAGGWRENKEQWKKYAEEFNRRRGGGAT